MELKTKYQYSYFIYPYVIDENDYDKYILRLLKDKHFKVKMWEKEKDMNIYTYFLPQIRNYLFWPFLYDNDAKKKFDELKLNMKSVLVSKYPCTMFEYNLEYDVQGKMGEQNGIFFNTNKIEVICFKTGICFLVFKTILEEGCSFSDVLNFNYKFRDINSEFHDLKNYENIRLQTDNFKDMKEINNIIKEIKGDNKGAKELNLEEERFLTYSYACIEQENWKTEEDFYNLEEEFIKYSNFLPNNYQLNYNKTWVEEQRLSFLKYSKIGITKQGTTLLTSNKATENYTKLPYTFENEYFYTYLLALYKKIYLNKVNLEFKKNSNFRKIKEKFLNFTREIWNQEITTDEKGTLLYDKWVDSLKLGQLYSKVKNSFDIEYKSLNIEKSKKIDYFIIILLISIIIGVTSYMISLGIR